MAHENEQVPAADAGPVQQPVRPPIGLRPAWIADYHDCRDRLIEINEAMTRYAEAGAPVPVEWCRELERRIDTMCSLRARHAA